MVNEAIRTRQYREVLDAEKNISRQIYNLYQRQQAAYNEGIPSIRNQNQLAPISGVIETVSAFQTELQNLMNSAANNYFQYSANNFVPVVKTFNSLVSALRSIQNIYKRDFQIKFEVDKLLKPVIDLIQSLASQLAYDPAISNRLFQMKTNLQSKVYERIDYNVGKRTLIKVDEEEKPTVQTFQSGSQEKMDTFQQPIQYNPESNDPFVGQERIKPETPSTFEGLEVAGYDLKDNDREQLKNYMDAVREAESPIDWTEATGRDKQTLKRSRVNPIINSYFDRNIRPLYEALPTTAKNVVDRNNKTEKYIKDILSQNFELFRGSVVIPTREKNARQRRQAPPQIEEPTRRQANAEQVAADIKSTPQPAVSLQASFSPIFSPVKSTPGSPKTLFEMSDTEIKEMLQSKVGTGVFNKLKSDKFVRGNSWPTIIENIKERFRQDPEAFVRHLNTNYNLSLPSPVSSGKRKGQRQDTLAASFSPVARMIPVIEEVD